MVPALFRGLFGAALLLAAHSKHAQAMFFGGPDGIKLRTMADMGMLPDGTPMEIESSTWQALAHGVASNRTEKIKPEFVTLPIDHYGGAPGTFQNRFWVAEASYKPGGPVFIYDNGEANAEDGAIFRLQNQTSFFKQIVDKFGGIGIVWEHRYYGESTPQPINISTPAEAFTWLTTEQALADIPVFASNFSRKSMPGIDLTPASTPWIFIGGSYPGMRAAFIRERYPETIFASYASSAPVQARLDMSVYFEQVVRGMKAYGFGNCTKDVHAAVTQMDKMMADSKVASQLKAKFLGPSASKNANADFADSLTAVFSNWQSFGVDGGAASIRNFCDWISTDPETNKTSGADGWASSKGANFTIDRWANWRVFIPLINSAFNMSCAKNSNESSPGCDLSVRTDDPDGISWMWQYCTQWGFFQSSNLGDTQVVSSFSSLQHQQELCQRQFPNASSSLLPSSPRINQTNAELGGWEIRPSNVYWSGGEFDPWRTLSPMSAESFAPQPVLTQDIPECGKSTNEKSLFGLVMKGAQHCYDFRTDFEPGVKSRQLFTDALSKWLQCYSSKSQVKDGQGNVKGAAAQAGDGQDSDKAQSQSKNGAVSFSPSIVVLIASAALSSLVIF